METLTYHKDIAGTGYYDRLPTGWRLATIKDFHRDGHLLVNKRYLLKNNSGQYEGYRTRVSTVRESILLIKHFIALDRCWVME